MAEETTPIGSIHVSPKAIATIAYHAAMQTYGVVGLAPKNFVNGLAHAMVKDPSHGVDVRYDGQHIYIDLFIIVEYGTRIKTVATTVAETVRFQVEKTLGMHVNEVNIHVQTLRVSNVD